MFLCCICWIVSLYRLAKTFLDAFYTGQGDTQRLSDKRRRLFPIITFQRQQLMHADVISTDRSQYQTSSENPFQSGITTI